MNVDSIISFLSRLPTTTNSVEWVASIKENLKSLFPEADYVVLNVVYMASQREHEVRLRLIKEGDRDMSVRRAYTPKEYIEKDRWKQIVDEDKNIARFPHEEYHPPIGIDAFLNDVYHGSVILFRKRHKTLFSSATLQLLRRLSTPIAHVFAYHAIRKQLEGPLTQRLDKIMRKASESASLTEREREILALTLYGFGVEAIADALCISSYTVRQHRKALYAKLNVHGLKDLIQTFWLLA